MKNLLYSLFLLMQAATPSPTGGGSIAGRLLKADGSPAVGVRVAAASVMDSSVPGNAEALLSLTLTDSAGRYRLERVPAGRYYIMAGSVSSPTYFPGVIAKTGAGIVTVSEGASFVTQDFRWMQEGTGGLTLRGRLVNESAMPRSTSGGGNSTPPPQGVQLTSNGVLIQTVSVPSQGGAFQFRNLRPGRYGVMLEPSIDGLPQLEVVLADKDIEDLQIRIPTAELGGTLHVENGGARPPIRLVLTSTVRWMGSQTFSVSEDTFSLSRIPIGTYGVEVQDLPVGYALKSITAGSANLLSEKLNLTSAASPKIAITLSLASLNWVRVHGVLTSRDATRPLPASVTMSTTTGNGSITAAINSDGSFEFPTVLPGRYTARLTPAPDSLPRIIVVGESNPANVEIPMNLPPVKVSGRLTGEDRMREQGKLGKNEFFQPVLSSGSSGSSIRPVLAANGTFEFPSVQPGTYLLNLEKTCAGCDSAAVNSANGTTFVVTDKDMTDLVLSTNR